MRKCTSLSGCLKVPNCCVSLVLRERNRRASEMSKTLKESLDSSREKNEKTEYRQDLYFNLLMMSRG